MKRHNDVVIGVKYKNTYLTPIKKIHDRKYGSQRIFYICKCDCGGSITTRFGELARRTFSCGCYARKRAKEALTTHGLSHTSEWDRCYDAWQRCNNQNHRQYDQYGGRGIRVVFDSIASMTNWVIKNMPLKDKSLLLDRINNDGHYEAGNLRWATAVQSARNTRNCRQVTIGSDTKCLAEWAEISGLSPACIKYRIISGMPQSMWLSQINFRNFKSHRDFIR